MTNESALQQRCAGKCELCGAGTDLMLYEVPASEKQNGADIMVCAHCLSQVGQQDDLDMHHWRCLNDSIWSEVPAVQVMAWRILKRLEGESWARDLLEMVYLDAEMMAWAEAGVTTDEEQTVATQDCNGAALQAGDTVTIIKDLNVKGTGFTAKRGTAVRNISLTDNPEHIEGRVNGTRIVLLTCFVKKS